jgi:hypothetical protein
VSLDEVESSNPTSNGTCGGASTRKLQRLQSNTGRWPKVVVFAFFKSPLSKDGGLVKSGEKPTSVQNDHFGKLPAKDDVMKTLLQNQGSLDLR